MRSTTLFERSSRLKKSIMQLAFGQEPCANPPETDDQTPLRADLFSDSQMEQHGKWLATQHQLAQSKQPDRLLKRLDDNEIIIFETCTLLTSTITAKRRIAPAGEWLLDNYYLIEEQIRTAKKHLPKGYSQELPRLAAGASCHLPRVYDIALEAISHGDGRVDVETLDRYSQRNKDKVRFTIYGLLPRLPTTDTQQT